MVKIPTKEEISSWIREGIESGRIRTLSQADIWAMQHGPLEPEEE